jgi:opacity protein-like surface antigen
VVGVAGGYNWNSRVSIEGEFTLLPSSENSGLVEVDSTVWTLTGNLLYHFTRRAFTPYGVVGVGFGHAGVDVDSPFLPLNFDTSSNEFVVNLGGGIERQFSDRLRFRGDLRYFFAGDLVPDYWRVSAGVTFAFPR